MSALSPLPNACLTCSLCQSLLLGVPAQVLGAPRRGTTCPSPACSPKTRTLASTNGVTLTNHTLRLLTFVNSYYPIVLQYTCSFSQLFMLLWRTVNAEI